MPDSQLHFICLLWASLADNTSKWGRNLLVFLSVELQYEGAAEEDGRKQSIFDTFTHREGITLDGGNGDVAVDQYHRYKLLLSANLRTINVIRTTYMQWLLEDIDLMSAMGVDAYRFSISWPRLIPGYDEGVFPPQRCSQPCGNCTAGNSTLQPYIVGHHVLLSHIAAVELYRKTYQILFLFDLCSSPFIL